MPSSLLTAVVALLALATVPVALAERRYPLSAQSSMGWDNDHGLHHTLWKQRHMGSLRDPVGPPPRFFTQDQDHFDGSNSNTWQQAYYVNDTFFVPGSDAPVFLCVGGEGPALDGTAVIYSVHCNDAVEFLQQTGAIMFALEHRYYGCHNMSACPVSSFLPKDSLKYLSSRQALSDIVGFVQYATQAYNLTQNKWVTFGGSYPGMLAGWFRLKFPHLAHAAIASSAPVKAQVDMVGYNDVVSFAFTVSDNGVGGSQECMQAIATGHVAIGAMFNTTAGRQRLAQLFGRTESWYAVYQNQADFAGNGVAQFPAQSNDPSCTDPSCNIKLICQVMTNTTLGDEVARLAVVNAQQTEWVGESKVERIQARRRILRDPNEIPDFWGYQTCTEFAFYQTCEVGSQCMFTQGYATLASQENFCQELYNISDDKVAKNVDYTNMFYGADKPAGECVLYPNGEVDPWHALSILTAPSAGIPVLWVPGASHHAWTHPTLPTDQPSVVQARAVIRQTVLQFLSQDCEQATN